MIFKIFKRAGKHDKFFVAIVLAILAYGMLWIDILYAETFTPTLLDAVKKMSFIETLLSPKGVFHLWIAIRVVKSPLLAVLYMGTVYGLVLLFFFLKKKFLHNTS